MPAGVLYDKQVVIEYILSRKKETRPRRPRGGTAGRDEASAKKAEAAAYESRIAEFVAQQEGLSQADIRARLPRIAPPPVPPARPLGSRRPRQWGGRW